MKIDLSKFLSRKFLLTLATLVAVTCITLGMKETGDAVSDGIVKIGGALIDMAVVLGYQASQGKVDAEIEANRQ